MVKSLYLLVIAASWRSLTDAVRALKGKCNNNGVCDKGEKCDECLPDCGSCPTPLPTHHSTASPSKSPVKIPPNNMSAKSGLIIGGQAVQSSAEHFADHVSWFYNYKQHPLGWQTDWAIQNNIEFVPMFSKDWLNNPDGTIRCRYEDTSDPPCTTDDAIDVISETVSNDGLEIKYLMGFNEMYNNADDMTPMEAAEYWTKYVQPAGVHHGLSLVSPTLNAKPNAINWFSDFLRSCVTIAGCDVDLIDVFAVHQYDCRESLWHDWYGGDQSRLVTELKANLGGSWSQYIKSRPLWITETNCYWEVLEIGERYPHPDSKGQCERTTGKLPTSHGKGSIATMEELSSVQRYSWWTLWNPQIKPNMLTYKAGQLTPAGRAYMNPGDTSVNCEYPGTKIYAQSASLYGNAERFQCGGTGTQMIKGLGNGGTATFSNVQVAFSGSHAMNIAFVTAEERDLSVTINNSPDVQTFTFVKSGEWCGNGGQSTVLPIEVDGFQQGFNTITFGNSNKNEPIIEWFSIVDDSIVL